MSLLLEAEGAFSKLNIFCMGKFFCDIGFNSKVDPHDEITFEMQEPIRYVNIHSSEKGGLCLMNLGINIFPMFPINS